MFIASKMLRFGCDMISPCNKVLLLVGFYRRYHLIKMTRLLHFTLFFMVSGQ